MRKIAQYKYHIISGVLLCLFLFSIINSAWLSDDSFISLTQIVNLHNGDGLVYNFGERVQAFTHPTWFFLLSLLTWMTDEYYYTIIIISILLSVAAISCILLYGWRAKNISAVLIGLSMLLFSKAFVDYTTSGLENPLSYFLFAVLLYFILIKNELSKQSLITVYILMALIFLNRMDYALILLPAAIYLLVYYGSKNTLPVLIAALPVIAWFLFSLFYFGHFFPNTFYAKLQAGYPAIDYFQRGMDYYKVQYMNDPITIILIVVGIILGIFRKGLLRAISIGLILYMLYFLKSGGDFMQGRFFAVPAFIAAFLIVVFLARKRVPSFIYLLLAIAIVFGAKSSSPLFSGKNYDNRNVYLGVADERGFYFWRFGLISPKRSWPKIVNLGNSKPNEAGIVCGGLGTAGLSKRDKVYFIDYCALIDPLLSQLPAIENSDWRVGHQYRHVPIDYEKAVLDSNTSLLDKHLNKLYSDVRLATQGRLWDPERWGAIFRINTRHYHIDYNMYKSPNIIIGESKRWGALDLPSAIGKIKGDMNFIKQGTQEGVASFGPYETLSAGKYRFDIAYISSEVKTTVIGTWDIAIELERIKSGQILGTDTKGGHIIQDFIVNQKFADKKVEIRSFYNGKGNFTIKSLTITRIE